jgi:iron complex transport system substrate-binding protein
LADVFVAGVDDYFDTIITLAGGQNVYRERGVRNPVVSSEGILWLNPDVIIDLARETAMKQLDRQTIIADWNELGQVEAVKNHRILVFDQDYDCVPGPRFIRLVEDLARVLHPDESQGERTEGREERGER